MENLIIQVGRKQFKAILSGEVKEYHLPVNTINADMLCAERDGNHYTGFKAHEKVTFKAGFSDDAPQQTYKVALIIVDKFEKYIPKGMKKGDTAFTIEFGAEINS